MLRVLLGVFLVVLCSSSSLMAASFSADVITPGMMGQTDKGKFYYKDKNTFRSDGMGMINISKDGKIYNIVTDTKKYVVQDLIEVKEQSPMAAWGDPMDIITSNKMQKAGKEEVAGYSCTIYEGTISFHEKQPPTPMKMWYSKKLKNLVKSEVTVPVMGKVVTYLENIQTGKQDASLFEVPKGYTQVDDMAEAMGMVGLGGMQMPGIGGDGDQSGQGGQAPSEEDMKKMMEQMKSIMKQMGQ